MWGPLFQGPRSGTMSFCNYPELLSACFALFGATEGVLGFQGIGFLV